MVGIRSSYSESRRIGALSKTSYDISSRSYSVASCKHLDNT